MNDTNLALLEKNRDILSIRDLATGTIATYTSYLTNYINWVEENLPGRSLSDVTWEEIRSYEKYLKDVRKLNPRTINVFISQLRDFYNYVLHKDWDRREVPLLRFDEKLPVVPTQEEVISIINAIDNPKHKAEIALLYSSGIRVSELCRLHCGDIHMSTENIYISRSKNRSDRYAILSQNALHNLIDYIHQSYRTARREDWLFPGQREGEHISSESVRQIFRRHLESIGLSDKGYRLHSLRHAFGLHLYNKGVDLVTIKEALGHKSLSSTMVYVTLGIGNGRTVKSPYDDI